MALSTCEAEYVGQTQACKEAIWLQSLLQQLNTDEFKDNPSATVIYCDNQRAIALAKNSEFHAQIKHFDIQHHWVCEQVAEGKVQLNYISTEEQVADSLIKALSRDKFVAFQKALGLESRILPSLSKSVKNIRH